MRLAGVLPTLMASHANLLHIDAIHNTAQKPVFSWFVTNLLVANSIVSVSQ